MARKGEETGKYHYLEIAFNFNGLILKHTGGTISVEFKTKDETGKGWKEKVEQERKSGGNNDTISLWWEAHRDPCFQYYTLLPLLRRKAKNKEK
ncbi:unnamed protein product [Orchesella dallaii]|uniref:Uncharacterized protein n=1 Tax=Orchesella dallaii TaxID=48710 RepID=A0ABP1QHT6_9HEXA